MRVAPLAALLAAACAAACAAALPLPAHAQPFPIDLRAALDDAVDLYRQTRAESYVLATDPNERYDVLVGAGIFGFGAADYLFALGDEAFEAEIDRPGGLGQGDAHGPPPLPAHNRRIHDGERGGLDASSCRSCHFVGGPDGSGAPTQVALFRGDGENLSTATVRDAPHVMGLGYIEIAARHRERRIQSLARVARQQAADADEPVDIALVADGVDYGRLTARPDGTLDTTEVRGIGPDLVIRPFGHKGRHATLVALVDEALQQNHGLQTASRIAEHRDQPLVYLGPGGPFDPDADGVQAEATAAQAVLLASYLSMLGTPAITPPDDPALALTAARGRARFADIGCADCHVPALRVPDLQITHTARGDDPFTVDFDLADAGRDPVPFRLDFSPDDDDQIPGGIPVFAYTDLRRHDMGPALAEPVAEHLPDGADPIPGHIWLTRPLWGLADTGPYLHDGRAPTVHDAILAHGGDAEASRAAYRALDPAEQGALRAFLMTLTRPPVILVE